MTTLTLCCAVYLKPVLMLLGRIHKYNRSCRSQLRPVSCCGSCKGYCYARQQAIIQHRLPLRTYSGHPRLCDSVFKLQCLSTTVWNTHVVTVTVLRQEPCRLQIILADGFTLVSVIDRMCSLKAWTG